MRKERIKAKVSDLVLNEGQLGWLPTNPRQWTQSDVDKTKASLKNDEDFMEDRPIMVLQCDGKLLVFAGNLRTTAAKALKWQVIDAVLYIPESDEDKETIKRRSILDNGAFGSWDYDMLANEWDDLPLPEWGVPAWDTENLESVSAPKEVEEDDFDESKDHIEVRCKKGDVWQLGDHRLMCGDSVSLDDVKKLMGGGIADIAFASPPYNTGGIGKSLTKDDGRSKYLANNDDMTDDGYTEFLNKYIHNACECSKYNFVNVQWLANNKNSLIEMIKSNQRILGDILVWDKARSQPAAAENVLNSEFEFVFCFHEKGNRRIGTIPFHGTKKNIFHISPGHNEYSEIHNAVFPIALPAHFIENFAETSVLDLFGGTGTTMIAAEQLGRKAYLMELDPRYCDVIIARWEKFTGRTAEKIQ